MKTLSKLTFVAFVALSMVGNTSADVGDILKAHFKAVGGLTRLFEIRTIKRSAAAQLTQLRGQPVNLPGTVETATVVGKKSYLKLEFGKFFNETTAWNGETTWKSSPLGNTTTLSKMELERTRGEAYTDPLQPIYEQHGSSAFQRGEDETFQGRDCFVIQIIGMEGLSYYIDKTSNLLIGLKVLYTDRNFGSGPVVLYPVVLYYTDYMEYEGVMLPNSREIHIGNGELTINYTYTKTEIDVALDETIFEKPLGTSGDTLGDIEDILKTHFEAIGGLKRLSKIRTVKRSGDAQVTHFGGQTMNMPGSIEVAAIIGKKSYVNRHFEWFRDTIVWNGREGWKSSLYDGTTTLSAMELEIAKQKVYITPFQRSYEQHGSNGFQRHEDEMLEGTECFVIQIIGVEGVENTFYYIDKTSNLLIGIKTPNIDPTFNSDTVIIHLSDYVEYNGVMFPNSREVSIGNNELNVNYAYTNTEIDVELDETIFEKP